MADRLLLIDGNSITYRAFFATAMSPAGIMRNSKGTPINAVLALSRMLVKVIDTYKPTHVLVAFDAGKKTKRHDKLESYKAGRAKTPEELIIQFPIVKKMLDLMGIKHFETSEIEADDIIGSIATQHCNDIDVLVLSSDRDMLQLVNETTTVIIPQSGAKDDIIVSYTSFKEMYGYMPHQVTDMKGLVGDSSDNLPGVAGIGPKGALKLLDEYESLENIYNNIDKITGSTKVKLETHKEMALLCKEIATIFRDIEVPFALDDLSFEWDITDTLISFYRELETNSLVTFFLKKQKETLVRNSNNFTNIIL